jgi:hypothetical protein
MIPFRTNHCHTRMTFSRHFKNLQLQDEPDRLYYSRQALKASLAEAIGRSANVLFQSPLMVHLCPIAHAKRFAILRTVPNLTPGLLRAKGLANK